jgi:histidine triad (HIT) family protein
VVESEVERFKQTASANFIYSFLYFENMPEKEITEEDLKNMSAEEIAELQKQNCIFCKISEKQIPAKVLHENSNNICILDINPASEGHVLVYPKKHYMILPHVPDDALSKLFKDVKLMSQTLLKALQCRGTTIFIANGAAAGQRAPHVLIHVFPRRENDDLVKLPKYEMSDEQIDKLSRELKPYINQLFGVRRPVIKEAEFVEKKETHHEPKHEPEEHHAEKTEHKEHHEIQHSSENKHHEPEKKRVEEKEEKTKEKSSLKKEEKKSSKVDLDDIARLFGG